MPHLLIIDDEPNVLYSLEKCLRSDSLQVLTASSGKQGLELVQSRAPDAVILDVRLSDMSGLDAFDRIRQLDSRLPVILITAFASTETAIEAMKRGAFEYLLKPVDFHQLHEVVGRAIELRRMRQTPAVFEEEEPADDAAVDRIVGRCLAMHEVYKAIGRVAPLDVPILILGESGTGKELVARALYHHSRRADKPFLAINCAAIPDQLLESELFGHERGAFTGADRRRIGKFEQCHGGTLFLDEIGDMTFATQPKLLRLLQEQRFERLGGNESIQTDVRVIAATNQGLDDLVESGRFRQDLLYRLNVFTIELPPLRQRLEDVPLLVEHFLKLLNRSLGKEVRAVAPETLRLLQAYNWPGNIRQLHSAVKYALVQATGDVLLPECLPENVRNGARVDRLPLRVPDSLNVAELVQRLLSAGEPEIYRKVCLEVDRVVTELVLQHVQGNQVQASELLGISRTTLRAKLRSLGIVLERMSLSESGQPE
jgi:nitrogen regulation protein NR(I)